MSQSQVSYIIIYATKKKMLKITMARTVLLYGITNLPLFQYQLVWESTDNDTENHNFQDRIHFLV